MASTEDIVFSKSLSGRESKEQISISTQTEWSWLEDVKRIGRLESAGKSYNEEPSLNDGSVSIDNDSGPESKDHLNGLKEDSIVLPKTAVKSLPNLSELRKGAKESGPNNQKSWLLDHIRQQEASGDGAPENAPYPTLDDPRGSLSEDSDSDSSEEEYDLDDPPFPSVGPPQMLEFLKHADARGRIDVGVSEFPLGDERWLHKSFFTGPCRFCGADVLPLPTVEEIKTFPHQKVSIATCSHFYLAEKACR